MNGPALNWSSTCGFQVAVLRIDCYLLIITIKNKQSLAKFLAGLQISILLDEVQRKQIFAGHAFLGVLLQDGSDELPVLFGDLAVARELNFVSYLHHSKSTIFTRSPCSLILKGEAPNTNSYARTPIAHRSTF